MRHLRISLGRCLAAAALLLLLAGCGGDPLHATPHGLTIENLASEPTAPAVAWPVPPTEGTWKGRVRKQWIDVRDGGPPRTGRAELALTVERRHDGDVLTTRIAIAVASSEGLGTTFVRDFDGLALTVRHDAKGSPQPATIRFEAKASPTAKAFVSGFWLAGLTGFAPWLPRGPVSVGEAWSLGDLGAAASLNAVRGISRARPRLLGGGRLESASMGFGGEPVEFEVRLESLVEVESSSRSEALSFGIRDRGRLTFDLTQALPVRWSLEEHSRLNQVQGPNEGNLDVVLRVDGELTPVDR